MNVPHLLGPLVVEHPDILVLHVLLYLLYPLEADGGGGYDQCGPGGNFPSLNPAMRTYIVTPGSYIYLFINFSSILLLQGSLINYFLVLGNAAKNKEGKLILMKKSRQRYLIIIINLKLAKLTQKSYYLNLNMFYYL